MGIDVGEIMELSKEEFLRLVRTSRSNIWEAQKNSESNRLEWLIMEAKENAVASGDQDWEKRVDKMHSKLKSSAVNRKLTAVTKGQHGALKMIQVPTHEWFYAEAKRELYRYHKGVFEAYPAATESLFYTHHTRKVLPSSNVQAVVIEKDWTGKYFIISTILPMPKPLWRDITAAEEIERELYNGIKCILSSRQRERAASAPAQ